MQFKDLSDLKSIIDGCVLGDAHLFMAKASKNASFNYRTSSEEHIIFVHNYFKDFCTENYLKHKTNYVYDKRTKKTYINYFFRTRHLPLFTDVYNRFYINKKKIVPKDIKITKELLLFWYIGDGELNKRNGSIFLHTNSFTYDDVLYLCDLLFEFDAKPVNKTKTQYMIKIKRKNVKKFLSYIGDSPFDEYRHKWKTVEYKNKNIEKNGKNLYDKDILMKILEEFLSDKRTMGYLSRKYNIATGSIKHYLIRNNINHKLNETKRIIKEYNLEGQFIKNWYTVDELSKEYSISKSMVYKILSGNRKYKHRIFKLITE